MYKFLLGLIMSTMVVLVACSPQEQESFVKELPAVQQSNKGATHHALAPSRPRAQVESPAFQL